MKHFNLTNRIKKLNWQNHVILENYIKDTQLLDHYGNELKNLPLNQVSKANLDRITAKVEKIKHRIHLDGIFERQERSVIRNLFHYANR